MICFNMTNDTHRPFRIIQTGTVFYHAVTELFYISRIINWRTNHTNVVVFRSRKGG